MSAALSPSIQDQVLQLPLFLFLGLVEHAGRIRWGTGSRAASQAGEAER